MSAPTGGRSKQGMNNHSTVSSRGIARTTDDEAGSRAPSCSAFRVDDVRVTCPLFQEEYGGSIPTSTLQLQFSRMDIKRALRLNDEWHSRLPKLTNWQGCFAYGAECAVVISEIRED